MEKLDIFEKMKEYAAILLKLFPQCKADFRIFNSKLCYLKNNILSCRRTQKTKYKKMVPVNCVMD